MSHRPTRTPHRPRAPLLMALATALLLGACQKPADPVPTAAAGAAAAPAAVQPVASAPAQAAPQSAPQEGALQLGQTRYRYQCGPDQRVEVTYVTTGAEHEGHPVFAVLRHGKDVLGLAPAVSASGSRYIGHAGLQRTHGVEWWEKGGEATLSQFKGDNASDTQPLLQCRMIDG